MSVENITNRTCTELRCSKGDKNYKESDPNKEK